MIIIVSSYIWYYDPDKFHEWINNNPPKGSVCLCVAKIERKDKSKFKNRKIKAIDIVDYYLSS